jgi:hypothetical protein
MITPGGSALELAGERVVPVRGSKQIKSSREIRREKCGAGASIAFVSWPFDPAAGRLSG